MANTVEREGNFITISDIDSDWIWPEDISAKLVAIKIIPGAVDEYGVFKELTAAGPVISKVESVDGAMKYDASFMGRIDARPMLDESESNYSANTKFVLMFRSF